MSLPHVSQQQIDEMNRIAAQKYGSKNDDTAVQQEPVMHPMLNAPEEPVFQEEIEEVAEEAVEEQSHDIDQEDTIEETAYAAPQESNKEYNLRVLRERAERAERERDEMMRAIMAQQKPQQQEQRVQPDEDEFSFQMDDEALVEGKHVKQLAQQVTALKKMLKQSEQQFKKTDQQTLEMRLQTQYPDFNKVVTHDNLTRLRDMNPDLADSILKNEDQYKQAKLAYDMVKQFGIYKDESFNADRIQAQKNIKKPRPLSAISPTQSESPLSKANAFAHGELTKHVKDTLYQEMLQAMKGL